MRRDDDRRPTTDHREKEPAYGARAAFAIIQAHEPTPPVVGRPSSVVAFDPLSVPLYEEAALIEASAGTGKTYSIAGLVLRLLLEGRVAELPRLLVVTFTVAATEELKTRIRSLLRDGVRVFGGQPCDSNWAPLLESFAATYAATPQARRVALTKLLGALRQVDEASIFTIHGFCKRVLEQAAFESGAPFAIEFTEDAEPLYARAAADFWHHHTHADPLIAALAAERKWGEAAFSDERKSVRRFPTVRLLPEPPSLDAARARLDAALDAVRQAWDVDALDAALRAVDWKLNMPLDTLNRRATLENVAALLDGQFASRIAALEACTPEAIANTSYKNNRMRREAQEAAMHHPAFRACGDAAAALRDVESALRHRFLEEVEQRYDALKLRERVFTFDDLLRKLYDGLRDAATGPALAAAIQRQWDAALIDEFQDTDPFQYHIFSTAFQQRPLFLIGDPKQAIYSFRGADIFTYIQAHADTPHHYTLDQNWRSCTSLVNAVNALFQHAHRPFLYDDILFQPVRAAGRADKAPLTGDELPPLVWWYVPPLAEANKPPRPWPKDEGRLLIRQAVVREIRKLLGGAMRVGERALVPGDIAVLVRSNKQAQQVQEMLRAEGVPAVISKTGSIFEARELLELEILLHAVARPNDAALLRAALVTECWGLSAADLHALNEDEQAWAEIVGKFQRWEKRWRTHGFMPMIHALLDEQKINARLLTFADGERRLTNLRHAIEVLHGIAQARQLHVEGLLAWLAARREEELSKEEKELRLESDAHAVQIVTIHSSKGLEYDVVFALDLWDPPWIPPGEKPLVHLPAPDGGQDVVYDLGSDKLEENRQRLRAEKIAEDLRLAYVALTRARHRCYVPWGQINQAHESALAYVLHGPEITDPQEPHVRAACVGSRAKFRLEKTNETLLALVEQNHGCMAVQNVLDVAAQPLPRRAESPLRRSLSVRPIPDAARVLPTWNFASFTGWTRQARALPATTSDAEPSGLHAFAGGLQAGQCLHDLLATVRFDQLDDDRTAALIRHTLRRFHLDRPEHHRAPIEPEAEIRAMLQTLAELPLLPDGTLAELPRRQQLHGWTFTLPLATPVAPPDLCPALALADADSVQQHYAPHLAGLTADKLPGFLRGEMDLVFEHDGRWYIIDWKSTRLGPDASAYGMEALREAMISNHYVLQYHLYTLALHRYLHHRLPGYDYDAHFGGTWTIFLRGLEHAETNGLFFDRPPISCIEALDAVMKGGAA